MKKLMMLMISICLLGGCVDQSQGAKEKELKIACTSVATCNILEALDVPADQVVGIPQSDTYEVPKRYQDALQLGSAMTPDMELLKTSKANLILSPNSLENDLAVKYENLKVDSVFLNLKSTAGMYKSIEELGTILGREAQAEPLVEKFKTFMQEYHAKHRDDEKVSILILMGLPGSYVVATENSYVGSLVKLAGGENVYTDDTQDFLNINPEDMLKTDPDIILRTSHALPEQVAAMFQSEFAENDIWKHFDAVKQQKVYDLDYTKFGMSATFAYQDALKDLETILYGDSQ